MEGPIENSKAIVWYTTEFFPAEQRADNCKECGEYIKKCPQQIKISEELKKAHAELTKEAMGPPPRMEVSFEE